MVEVRRVDEAQWEIFRLKEAIKTMRFPEDEENLKGIIGILQEKVKKASDEGLYDSAEIYQEAWIYIEGILVRSKAMERWKKNGIEQK